MNTVPTTLGYEGIFFEARPELCRPGWFVFFGKRTAATQLWLIVQAYRCQFPDNLSEENIRLVNSREAVTSFMERRERIIRRTKRRALEEFWIPGEPDMNKMLKLKLTDVFEILAGKRSRSEYFHPGLASQSDIDIFTVEERNERRRKKLEIAS